MSTQKKPTINLLATHRHDRTLVDVIAPNIKTGPWIAGGAALAWYNGQPAGSGDVDIFFASKEQFDETLQRIQQAFNDKNEKPYFSPIVNGGWSAGDELEFYASSNNSVSVLFDSPNALTLSTRRLEKDGGAIDWRIQLIRKHYFSSWQDIINMFDITVCQVVTDGMMYYLGPQTAKDIKHKKLHFTKLQSDSVKRLIKYWSYGYEPESTLLEDLVNNSNFDWDFESDQEYQNAF